MSSPAKKKKASVKSFSLARKDSAWVVVQTTVSIEKGTVVDVQQVTEPDMLPITTAKLLKLAREAADES